MLCNCGGQLGLLNEWPMKNFKSYLSFSHIKNSRTITLFQLTSVKVRPKVKIRYVMPWPKLLLPDEATVIGGRLL
jgi:hypothetical protein